MAEVLGHTSLSEHAVACQFNAQAGLSFLLICLALSRLRAAQLQPACMTRRAPEQHCWSLMECLLAPCSLVTMLIIAVAALQAGYELTLSCVRHG